MVAVRKNNDSPAGPNLDRLPKLVARIEKKQSDAADARGDLGSLYKEAEDVGFNRPALKLSIKLKNMEAAKRQDFLSSLNTYCEVLGVWDQGDMFPDEVTTSVGPSGAHGAGGELETVGTA